MRQQPYWMKISVITAFIVIVNGMSGYLAIQFRFPSLWNVQADFSEYAFPVNFNWALAHWPTMAGFAACLWFVDSWSNGTIKRFRWLLVLCFLLTLFTLPQKIPFTLFPMVDAFFALLFSFILSPVNKTTQPILFRTLWGGGLAGLLAVGYAGYMTFIHTVPQIQNTEYVEKKFHLHSIELQNNYKKELSFVVDIHQSVTEAETCNLGQLLAKQLLIDYPFDENFSKLITLRKQIAPASQIKEVGEISLDNEHKQQNGEFACYVKF